MNEVRKMLMEDRNFEETSSSDDKKQTRPPEENADLNPEANLPTSTKKADEVWHPGLTKPPTEH